MMQRRAKRTNPPSARRTLGTRRLDELIEEAIVDAYRESEQRVGFLTMLEDGLAFPFKTEILGAPSSSNAWISMTPKRSSRSAAAQGKGRFGLLANRRRSDCRGVDALREGPARPLASGS